MAANADLLPQPAVATAVGIDPALAAAFVRPSLALAAMLAGFGCRYPPLAVQCAQIMLSLPLTLCSASRCSGLSHDAKKAKGELRFFHRRARAAGLNQYV